MKKLILKIINRLKRGVWVNLDIIDNEFGGNMKKLLLLALTAVVMAGCFEANSKQKEEREALRIYYKGVYYTPNGCEYYIYDNSHRGIPIHKQDCRKCTERRKQELKELIKELKE